MDRAEGALLVAEQALSEARAAAQKFDEISLPDRNAASFVVNTAGELVIVYDDGSTLIAGRIRGEDGAPGASIIEGTVDPEGALVLRLDDGRLINAGNVRGDPGPMGPPGPIGEPGQAAEWPEAPEETYQLVGQALMLLAESPPIPSAQQQAMPIILNIGLPEDRPARRKTVTTRRDPQGNLVADIVEE